MTDQQLNAILEQFQTRHAGPASVADVPDRLLKLLQFVRDQVHPGEVFGDRVAFVPGVAEAACDGPGEFGDDYGPHIGDDPEEADGVTVTRTDREGLVAELANALKNGDRVALVVSGEQLAVLIRALQVVPKCNQPLRESVAEILPSLRQLFDQAFGPP